MGLGLTLLVITSVAPALAQKLLPPDPAISVGRVIPFDGFLDEEGRDAGALIRAADRSVPRRPWVVSPIYTRCQHTCTPITASLRAALEQSEQQTSAYHVLSFSFDPAETPEGLRAFRARLRLPQEWITLRAPDRTTLERTLAALDFRTIAIGEGAIEHPNLIAILTPDRRLAQYLFGVTFTPSAVAGALQRADRGVPALAGREGSVFAFAALGFVISAFIFFSLLSRRRARLRR